MRNKRALGQSLKGLRFLSARKGEAVEDIGLHLFEIRFGADSRFVPKFGVLEGSRRTFLLFVAGFFDKDGRDRLDEIVIEELGETRVVGREGESACGG